MKSYPSKQATKLMPLIVKDELNNNDTNNNMGKQQQKQAPQFHVKMEANGNETIMAPVKIENSDNNNNNELGPIVNKYQAKANSKLMGVGKYKVYKCPSRDGICYFLRCFWHLLSDPESDHVAHWHPMEVDKFIIPDDSALEDFLQNYGGFRMTLNSFRRSLYFYGFKKMKTEWFHQQLNNTDRGCLSQIKRRASSKRKERKLQQQYMQLMMAQMSSMQHQFYKSSLPPTNYSLGYGSGGPSPPTNMVEMMANHAQYSGYHHHVHNNASPIEYLHHANVQQQSPIPASGQMSVHQSQLSALSSAIINELPPVVHQEPMQMDPSSAVLSTAANLGTHLPYRDMNGMYALQPHHQYDAHQQSISPEDVKMNDIELMPNF